MQHAASLVVTPEFRTLVQAMAQRLGPVRLVVAPEWQNVADQFDLRCSDEEDAAVVVVGFPATVLKHAAKETKAFGFVAPDAQFARFWQRTPQVRDDTALRLWKLGWSPISIDRLLVPPTNGASLEYVISAMRRTPAPAVEA